MVCTVVVRLDSCRLSVLTTECQPPEPSLKEYVLFVVACCLFIAPLEGVRCFTIFVDLCFAPLQLITFYKEVFEREGLPLWLKPYSILSTAKTTGLIEVREQPAFTSPDVVRFGFLLFCQVELALMFMQFHP